MDLAAFRDIHYSVSPVYQEAEQQAPYYMTFDIMTIEPETLEGLNLMTYCYDVKYDAKLLMNLL